MLMLSGFRGPLLRHSPGFHRRMLIAELPDLLAKRTKQLLPSPMYRMRP
jgi:hypothetical protein